MLPKLKLYTAKDSAQEIITPLDIRYYKSGTVKCSFTKRIYRNRKVKEYPTYLLLQKRFNKYLITGESDLITDSNKKITLNLGDEIDNTVSKTVLIVISFISLFLGALAFYLIKKRRDKIIEDRMPLDGSLYLKKEEIIVETKKDIQPIVENLNKAAESESAKKEKGDAFERYVVDRLRGRHFVIKDWRSDKYHNGLYAVSNKYPDIEVELNTLNDKVTFAIECKWRSEFYNNEVKFAEEYQIENYREYSKNRDQKVFIVLGIGGTASSPESVYILPLDEIHSNTFTAYQLKKYRRYNDGSFFFDARSKSLR